MARMVRTSAALATVAMALAACGSGGDDGGDARVAGSDAVLPAMGEECTEDKVGGTITMGEFSMLPSFAPGQGGYGVRGGAQSAAIYDRLMRWDAESAEFVPQLAEGLEANDDNSVWTLSLREGVEFSNGDPLNAEDVAFTLGLHQDPAVRSSAMTTAQQVENVEVVDDHTVEFTLDGPWLGFPILLAGPVGEVVPQQAYEASTPEEWMTAPIGAGPFVLEEYVPDQRSLMKPNANYYGGPVCPTLEFVRVPGSQGTLEAFQNGELDLGFLRGPQFVADAVDAGAQGFPEIVSSGAIINMNNGAAGYDGPFTDVRARQAVGYALDRELIDQRLNAGLGQPTSALLAESSRFYDGEEGPSYDEARASELVAEVKADTGWDGSITLLIAETPEAIDRGVVLKALLDAVGFDVTLENTPVSQVTARQFTGDFEIVAGGMAVSDADPTVAFESALVPGGSTNITGTDNQELIAAINELKAAASFEEQQERLLKLQDVHNKVMPFTVFANDVQIVTVAESVHGMKSTVDSIVLFDNAYVEE